MTDELTGREIQVMIKLREKQYCIEELCKSFSLTYNYIHLRVASLKTKGFVEEKEDPLDQRRKTLFLTKNGLIYLAKLEARKSAIAKIDSWLDKKFNEIGIDCERLFK